jgi:hypothetical protein
MRHPAAIKACDGWNIVKKGGRKSKHLLSFPGLLEELVGSAGGPLGTLVDMDTQHPALVIQLPEASTTVCLCACVPVCLFACVPVCLCACVPVWL